MRLAAPTPENLPDSPGVYLFQGAPGQGPLRGQGPSPEETASRPIFLTTPGTPRRRRCSALFREIETIGTNTELEALLLENALIKKHRPRYNVCLRDDKTYPYIKVTTGEPWPRALVTRRVLEDGHSYFGPFWGGLARRIMRMITRHFQIRTCAIEIDGKLPRPCLYYDLHACLGPVRLGPDDEGGLRRGGAPTSSSSCRGGTASCCRGSRGRWLAASGEENFEMAAAYRDAIRTVEDVAERQLVQSLKGESVDAFGFFEAGGDVSVCVLVVRGGSAPGPAGVLLREVRRGRARRASSRPS